MPQFFDIHSHLNFKDYGSDFDEVIGRLKETDTHTIVVGTDLEQSQKAVELADKHREIYACIGVHPVDNPSRVFDKDNFQELVSNPKVVAVGECGLDFFHSARGGPALGGQGLTKGEIKRQQDLFLNHIDFAIANNKAIMIHSRDAYEEVLNILEPIAKKEGERLFGNVHFFAGDKEIARRFFDIGFTVSFTGVLTFTHDYDEVVKFAPIDMIMSETDAPYVAPVPYRGKRNEPSYVSEVVKKIAEIRGASFEEVREVMVKNALRVFKIVI